MTALDPASVSRVSGISGISRIIGIDPGTRVVGYGVLELDARRFRYLECGVIRTAVQDELPRRLLVIARELGEVMDEFRPTAVALERAFHGRNAASALKLGSARGAIMAESARRAVPVFEYAPAKVKRLVAGHGRAAKADIQRRVMLLCRLGKAPPLDAADALAIALCHAQTVGVG